MFEPLNPGRRIVDYNIDAVELGGFQARNVAIVIRRKPGVSQIVTSRPEVGHAADALFDLAAQVGAATAAYRA